MTNILSALSDNEGARYKSKRGGRGIGSGKGKTCGSGMKGQKARSGVAINGFEGGQTPIHRRLPKRGFNNISRKEFEAVNLGRIQKFIDTKMLDSSKKIDKQALIESGIVNGKKYGIKLLAGGELTSKINIEIDSASKSAISQTEKAGGTIKTTSSEEK